MSAFKVTLSSGVPANNAMSTATTTPLSSHVCARTATLATGNSALLAMLLAKRAQGQELTSAPLAIAEALQMAFASPAVQPDSTLIPAISALAALPTVCFASRPTLVRPVQQATLRTQ